MSTGGLYFDSALPLLLLALPPAPPHFPIRSFPQGAGGSLRVAEGATAAKAVAGVSGSAAPEPRISSAIEAAVATEGRMGEEFTIPSQVGGEGEGGEGSLPGEEEVGRGLGAGRLRRRCLMVKVAYRNEGRGSIT